MRGVVFVLVVSTGSIAQAQYYHNVQMPGALELDEMIYPPNYGGRKIHEVISITAHCECWTARPIVEYTAPFPLGSGATYFGSQTYWTAPYGHWAYTSGKLYRPAITITIVANVRYLNQTPTTTWASVTFDPLFMQQAQPTVGTDGTRRITSSFVDPARLDQWDRVPFEDGPPVVVGFSVQAQNVGLFPTNNVDPNYPYRVPSIPGGYPVNPQGQLISYIAEAFIDGHQLSPAPESPCAANTGSQTEVVLRPPLPYDFLTELRQWIISRARPVVRQWQGANGVESADGYSWSPGNYHVIPRYPDLWGTDHFNAGNIAWGSVYVPSGDLDVFEQLKDAINITYEQTWKASNYPIPISPATQDGWNIYDHMWHCGLPSGEDAWKPWRIWTTAKGPTQGKESASGIRRGLDYLAGTRDLFDALGFPSALGSALPEPLELVVPWRGEVIEVHANTNGQIDGQYVSPMIVAFRAGLRVFLIIGFSFYFVRSVKGIFR